MEYALITIPNCKKKTANQIGDSLFFVSADITYEYPTL